MAGFVDKIKNMWNPSDDDYEDEYDNMPEEEYEDEAPAPAPRSTTASSSFSSIPSSGFSSRSSSTPSNVVNFSSGSSAKSQLQVVVFKPTTYADDAKAIADALLSNCAVILNLERTSDDDYLKILLFINGVNYAKAGNIKPVATKTFIITPKGVELSGDILFDELENSGVSF